VSCIFQIRHQLESKTSVRKALRNKLEDVLSPTMHDDVKEEETSDIYALAALVRKGSAPEMAEVQVLWAGQERSKIAARVKTKDSRTTGTTGGGDETTDTEAEGRSKGLGLLKNIGDRANRAGKRLGGFQG
jgi:hypothetical protein